MAKGVIFCGKCQDMCPRAEIELREKERLLHRYELTNETVTTGRPKADYSKCVKQFSRPAAGQAHPRSKDLRPTCVLKKTVVYLIRNILTLEKEDFALQYEFVFDRLRAVRQDIVIQNEWNADVTFIYESIVRFHIYSIYRLCMRPVSVFDPYINGTHLQECLKRLIVFYEEADTPLPNRCEIECYYLLYNLGSNDAIIHALLLPQSIRSNEMVKLSLEINFAWMKGNYVRVMKNISNLPFLYCVAVMNHIGLIQRFALKAMNTGYSAKHSNFPINLLKSLLLFDNEADTLATCHRYGIKAGIDDRTVLFYKPHFNNSALVDDPKQFKFIQEKHHNKTVPDIILKSESM